MVLTDEERKEHRRISRKKYKDTHKESVMNYNRKHAADWRINNPALHKKQLKDYRVTNTNIVINHYSNGKNICKCCGEDEHYFLTIDHINGGGRKERNENKVYGAEFHRWLIKNNFPEGYQVLCFNCNCSKNRTYEHKGYLFRKRFIIFIYTRGSLKCMCCGQDKFECLTVDHINSNGGIERKSNKLGGSCQAYYWLVENHFPKGIQILCYNCNSGRARCGGICPHKKEEKVEKKNPI